MPELERIGNFEQKIHVGDCLHFLSRLTAGTVPMVFADPPFNIGVHYDVHNDKQKVEEYRAWSGRWITAVHRVLTDTGTFWLCMGDAFVSEIDVLAKQLGFYKRRDVIWYFTFGQNSKTNLTSSHYHLLYYTKHPKEFTFNGDTIKVPSIRQEINDKRADPGGKVPDDLWITHPKDMPEGFCSGEDTWTGPRVAGTFKERKPVPTQLPERIVSRAIKMCSNPGDLVVDPFAGSGTASVVAKKLGRKYLSCEVSEAYAAMANARLNAANVGDELEGSVLQGELEPATTAE